MNDVPEIDPSDVNTLLTYEKAELSRLVKQLQVGRKERNWAKVDAATKRLREWQSDTQWVEKGIFHAGLEPREHRAVRKIERMMRFGISIAPYKNGSKQ